MDNISFDKILFKSAFAVMACDGEIHSDEISKFKVIAESTPYFFDIDFESELKNAVDELKLQSISYIDKFLESLKITSLKEKQKLLLVEVIFKIIEADKKVDDNELKFLNMVTHILSLSEEFLIMKSPKRIKYFINMSTFGTNTDFSNSIKNIKGLDNIKPVN